MPSIWQKTRTLQYGCPFTVSMRHSLADSRLKTVTNMPRIWRINLNFYNMGCQLNVSMHQMFKKSHKQTYQTFNYASITDLIFNGIYCKRKMWGYNTVTVFKRYRKG